MSPITFDVPDELADRLRLVQDRLPWILELGLRELSAAAQDGFQGTSDVLEFLARLPSPEETLALHPSAAMQARLHELLEKNQTVGLSPQEQEEWEQYAYLEHLVRLAKSRALLKLKQS